MRSDRNFFSASMESVIRSLVVLCFLAFIAPECRPVWAESNVWTRIGPAGANLAAVAIDPQNPSTVYVAANGSSPSEPTQVFKSIDGGANWIAISALPVPSQGLRTIDAL